VLAAARRLAGRRAGLTLEDERVAITPGPESRGPARWPAEGVEPDGLSYVPIRPGGPAWTFGVVTRTEGAGNPASVAFTETLDRMHPDTGTSTLDEESGVDSR
jgi:hypothetical protein